MDQQNPNKPKAERKSQRSVLTFLIFLAISTAAWFLVKLSEDYSTQTSVAVALVDGPADQWVSSPEQKLAMSLNIDGFHTLRYKMLPEAKQVVTVSLDEVPYRQESGNTYSFGSQYVVERIAAWLDIDVSNVTMNDSKIYFTMNPLKSRVVPIVLCSDIKPQRQYGVYGIPTLEPAMVTIFGPEGLIDTVRSVRTDLLAKSNVSEDFSEVIGLDLLGGNIRCNTKEVKVSVEVERYTEKEVEVPIQVPNGQKLRLFPENMTVKCHVAMKDYASISSDAFTVTVEAQQLKALQPLLDVRLVSWPDYVQILGTHPDKVEYLIVQ